MFQAVIPLGIIAATGSLVLPFFIFLYLGTTAGFVFSLAPSLNRFVLLAESSLSDIFFPRDYQVSRVPMVTLMTLYSYFIQKLFAI